MSEEIYKCENCGTEMDEVGRHEDGNYRDQIALWCPECGTHCGSFGERSGPSDHRWRFPRMTAFPEVKAALAFLKDGAEEGDGE